MKIAVPKLEKSSYIILAFIFLFFFVSLMVWVARFPGIRRTFIFHASDSDKYRIETRYVPINTPVNKYYFLALFQNIAVLFFIQKQGYCPVS